jgi:hypothetical protein
MGEAASPGVRVDWSAAMIRPRFCDEDLHGEPGKPCALRRRSLMMASTVTACKRGGGGKPWCVRRLERGDDSILFLR